MTMILSAEGQTGLNPGRRGDAISGEVVTAVILVRLAWAGMVPSSPSFKREGS
jgi:hypothetical protein